MKPIVEWLITVAGGMIGGGLALLIGCGIAALVGLFAGFSIATFFILIVAVILSGLGAMLGGNLAGRFIDRYNGYDDRHEH
jgi:hypothetical protein